MWPVGSHPFLGLSFLICATKRVARCFDELAHACSFSIGNNRARINLIGYDTVAARGCRAPSESSSSLGGFSQPLLVFCVINCSHHQGDRFLPRLHSLGPSHLFPRLTLPHGYLASPGLHSHTGSLLPARPGPHLPWSQHPSCSAYVPPDDFSCLSLSVSDPSDLHLLR